MIKLALFFIAVAVALVLFDILIDRSKKKKTDHEALAILAEQERCQHVEKIQVGGLAWNYGIGIICKQCGKEMKEDEEKLYDELFPERHEQQRREAEVAEALRKNKKTRDL